MSCAVPNVRSNKGRLGFRPLFNRWWFEGTRAVVSGYMVLERLSWDEKQREGM